VGHLRRVLRHSADQRADNVQLRQPWFREPEDHFRQSRWQFNGVYNWERGALHPFATAGAGIYWVRELLDGANDPDSDTRGGLNFGGGIEYFTGEKGAVKGEARWDIVSRPEGFPDATGFTITFGYKAYF
jgi:hypothetical protein